MEIKTIKAMISSSNWLLLVSQGSAWCPSLLEKDLIRVREMLKTYTLPDRSFDVIKRTKKDLKELIVCMHQPSITPPPAPPIPPSPNHSTSTSSWKYCTERTHRGHVLLTGKPQS